MGLFSDSLIYSADTTAAQGGDLSFGTKAGASVYGAVVSGLGSIYNTGVAVANALGADAEEVSTFNKLAEVDQNWADYYKENSTAIDVAGFIGTSLLPGGLAVKGLKAFRAGEATNAFGRALNFPVTRQAHYLDNALKELGTQGGSIFTQINKNKIGMMGWEFADQALQAATFELAVALTMKQSPLLADDNWWDIGKGIATGALLGGAIGGGIGALGISKDLKNAVVALDRKAANYTALSGLDNVGLDFGDQAFGLIDSILRLPKEVLADDKMLDVVFKLGSGPVTKSVPVSKYLEGTIKQSTKVAMEEFEITLRKLAGGNSSTAGNLYDVSQPLSEFVLGRYKALAAAGAEPSKIRDEIGNYLWELKKVSAATEEPLYKAQDLFYFKKTITADDLKNIKGIEDLRDIQVSSTPLGKGTQAYDKPYIFLGNKEQLADQTMAMVGRTGTDGVATLAEAWKQGYNIAMDQTGALRINQASKLWKRVEDPVFESNRYLNTRTGAVTEDAVLTAADRVVAGKKLRVVSDAVELETKSGVKTIKMTDNFKGLSADLEYATARHAWAGELPEAKIPSIIDSKDVSLLDRLRTASSETLEAVSLRAGDSIVPLGNSIEDVIYATKRDALIEILGTGEKDIRELAYRLNSTEQWVENMIASEFGYGVKNTKELMTGLSRELKDFNKRENLVAQFARPQQFTALDVAASSKMSWREKRDMIMEQAKNAGGQFVTGELAYTYRVQAAVLQNMNAAAAVLGADKIALLPKLDQTAAKLADSLGSGASFLGAANASYGETLKLAVQDIGKHVHKWIGEASDDVVSSLSSHSTAILNNKSAAAELGIVTNILRNDAGKFVLDAADTNGKTLVLRELAAIADPAKRAALEADLVKQGRRVKIEIQADETMAFLKRHAELTADRTEKAKVLINARGLTSNFDSQVFYAPPINTNYFQHFAFVRGVDGKAFGTSEVAMVFGRDAAELQKRISLVDKTQFEVITKDAGERYYKAKGQYDFDQTINERSIDSSLRRSGALADFFPETRAENILEDYLRWNQNQATKLVRNAVESRYSQQISELRALGSSYTEDATSKFAGTLKAARSEVVNPYNDYVKTMLDISKRSEYPFFHQANEFVDALGTRAYRILGEVTGKAEKGLVPWQEASAIAERHGIKGLYSDGIGYFEANVPRDRNLIKEYVARANTLLANVVLRFDFAQSIMNVVSTPLLLSTELASIRSLVAKDAEAAGMLKALTSVKVPGEAIEVPSTMRLLHGAVANWFGPEKDLLLKRYIDNGDVKRGATLYHEAIKDLSLSPNFKVFSESVEKATEKVATLTGNNWSEDFTRFVSADVMRQLSEPLVKRGLLDVQTQNAYISTFVNRVQGNYISSQRPVVFQGVIGGAIGLFQTYSFNLLQQLFRHVENRDMKAVATMYGMQAGLFGLNGTPMFDAINTHIIGNAAINQGHYDAYSIAPQLLSKEYGDWLMYGTVSAFPAFGDKWPALYSRGDINPRHMTILPSTLADIPAIDASIRAVKNLAETGKKIIGGADISTSLLQGLEHNGLNRPLAGLAQVMSGQSTTSKGGIISAHSDMESIATLSRVVGAKPMDEAIALNNMYRLQAYRVADQERLQFLGEKVKTHLTQGKVPSTEEYEQFMKDYASIGGRLDNFNAAMQRWMKDANVSVVEKMRSNMNTPYAQRLNEIMGGVPLEDNRNSPQDMVP